MDQTMIADDQSSTSSYQEILDKDILELMGASDLPNEKKQELYATMLDTIQNRVIARMADQLPEQDLERWQQLAETGDNAQMEQFLRERQIDIAQLMLQEALMYKTELVELAKPLQQTPTTNQ